LLSTENLFSGQRIIKEPVCNIASEGLILYSISGLAASPPTSGKAEESGTAKHGACYQVYARSRNTELNYSND